MLNAPIPDFVAAVKNNLHRTHWNDFPEVVIHAEESVVKKHAQYAFAKSGDHLAATKLVHETLNVEAMLRIRQQIGNDEAVFLPVHALETEGVNVIPRVLANLLGQFFKRPVLSGVIQTNRVSHTGASGYARLAAPAIFAGEILSTSYYLVDDFIGQGGTLANLKGFVENRGARVLGATTLTGKSYSRVLTLQAETLRNLRSKYGNELEQWWLASFGYGFEKLTESEARYLFKAADAHTITTRLAEAERKGN